MDAEEALDSLSEEDEEEPQDSLQAELNAAQAALEAREEQLDELRTRQAEAAREQARLKQALADQRREDRELEDAIDRCEEELEQSLDGREFAEQKLDRSNYAALLADDAVSQARAETLQKGQAPVAELQSALLLSRRSLDDRIGRLEEVRERIHDDALHSIDLRAELKVQLRIGRARSRQLTELRRLIARLELGTATAGADFEERRRQLIEDLRVLHRELATRRTLARQREEQISELESRLQTQMEQMMS